MPPEAPPSRSRVRTWLRRVAVVFAVLLVAIQLVPVNRSNPPVEGDNAPPPEVHAVLKRACYDCHSHETVWPWYAYVAPASWLVGRDVREGRKHLNFSRWETYEAKRRNRKMMEIEEMVASKEMPPWFYVPLHAEAKLGDAERALLSDWARSQR